MTDQSSVASRNIGAVRTLLGGGNSLENVTTNLLDDGCFCYVESEHKHYELHKDDSSDPSPPNVIKPIAGPGRWVPAAGGAVGPQGYQGAQGRQGAQGTQGAGFQGAQGSPGNQGFQGAQGTQGSGAQGAVGPQGNQGAQGAQGSGFQGAQGGTGVQGFQGAQGTQGAGFQGAQGSTGSQGPSGGAQGAQGASGTQGFQGAQGTQGAGFQGASGAQGNQGSQGFQGGGFQGAQGRQGASGTAGTAGNQGSQGAAGAAGTQGAQGASGSGSQGAQGAAGSQGFQGADGAAGTQGAQGAQGFQGGGFQGAQGRQGSGGAQGSQGATGVGAQGAQGGSGVQGFQGAQGFQGGGFQGAQGQAGAQGSSGGAQGAQGATGAQGFQGAQGTQGAGFQGAQGQTGAQGSSGGAQGAQGAQGASGTQGFQGAQGVQGAQASNAPFRRNFYVDPLFVGTSNGSQPNPFPSVPAAIVGSPAAGALFIPVPFTSALTGDITFPTTGIWEVACPSEIAAQITGNIVCSGTSNGSLTLTNMVVSGTIISDVTSGVRQLNILNSNVNGAVSLSGSGGTWSVTAGAATTPEPVFGSLFGSTVTIAGKLLCSSFLFLGALSVTDASELFNCLMSTPSIGFAVSLLIRSTTFTVAPTFTGAGVVSMDGFSHASALAAGGITLAGGATLSIVNDVDPSGIQSGGANALDVLTWNGTHYVPLPSSGSGAQGFQGAQGGTGAQGPSGATGNQGAQGRQGAAGVAGSQGSQGFQGGGAQGAQGRQGADGAGAQGNQGAQGGSGASGAQGAQGAAGSGSQGAQGASGAAGTQGFQGAQGNQGGGFQGASGTQGAQGSQGAQGNQGGGFQGAQGFQGQVGPGGGAQGAQGASGTAGAQGFQGAQGNQGGGFQGASGAQGAQGLQGAQGRQGATGNTGTTGNQGAQGATGAAGTTGTTGAQGATGATGNQGGTGAQGPSGATGNQGAQGRQGATGTAGAQGFQGGVGATGAQGFQGATGQTGTTGNQGAQGASGTQGAQGSNGSSPLTQVYYVDSANAGTATGSIAQPYASPAAAIAARGASDLTLLIAPGSYTALLTISSAHNITLVGLGPPTDQTVTLGSINLAFTTVTPTPRTLTLQNIVLAAINDSSGVASNITLIDTQMTTGVTGSGTGASNTILRMSSVVAGQRATGMSVALITSVTQVFGDYAIIGALGFSSAHGAGETFPNTFNNCLFTVAPTTGPLLCDNCAFPQGITAVAGGATINRLTNCTIDGALSSTTGTNALYLSNCRVGAGSPTSTISIGWSGIVNCRNTIFGPMSSGAIALSSSGLTLQLDAMSERSLFSSGAGQATIAASVPAITALDQGEANATQVADAAATYTFGSSRLLLPLTKLTADRTVQLSLTSASALDILPLDVYGTNTHTLTVQFNSVTIKTIAASAPPARYLFQSSEDNLLVVYVGAEDFQ